MIVTAGISFSASAKEVKTYTSYAESQFIASSGQLLGSALVDPLADALENSGARSSVPTATAGKTGEQYVSGPLDPLKALTGPVGTALDAQIGAAGSFANTNNDLSAASSGAVTNRGLVDVGSSSAQPSNAKLNLTGPSSSLGALNGLGDVILDTGAIGSSITQESAGSAPKPSYKLAGGTLTLQVPALADLNTSLGGVVGDLDTTLAPQLTLSQASVCTLLFSLGSALPGGLQALLPANQGLCEALPQLGSLSITGLDALTTGLENVTKDGITFDFATGKITVDIAAAFKALDEKGRDINSLPENTDLLAVILPGVTGNLDTLVKNVKTELVDELTSKLKVEGSVLGITVGPLALSTLNDAGLQTVVDTLFDGVDTALAPISTQLSDLLTDVLGQIQPLVKVTVNVPNTYRDLVAPRLKQAGVTTAASKTTSGVTSVSALRVQLLTVGGSASALDLLLGNSLVGPNSVTTADADGGQAAAAGDDRDADNPGSDGNGDSVADGAQADGTNGGSSDTVADSDAQADADVTTTLPSTGAPNLLPFWLLGIALLLFGGAVLLNEKRRLNQI
ncbi:MAG: choice-of-anchor G family protein [Aeromicrobium sp.]